MLLDSPSASVWLSPSLNLMSTILYLCKHKAHRINLELCGNIVINHFRQLWSLIIVTRTPNMYRSIFFNACRTARHSFSTVEKCVSRGNNFFAKYAIGCSRLNSFCWASTAPQTELRTVSLQSECNIQIWWLQNGSTYQWLSKVIECSKLNTAHLKFISLIFLISSVGGNACWL